MRLNRGTIALIFLALIVIVGVSVFNNNQAAAPGASTPTPETTTTALWPALDQNTVTRLEVRDNHTGQAIVLGKAQNGGWDVVDSGISEAASSGTASSVTYIKPQSFTIDTSKVTSSVNAFAGLTAADKFDADSPADFGMDKPLYTIYATTNTGAIYAMHVGNKNPNNTRYYVTVQQIAGASTTPEATEMQLPNPVLGRNLSTFAAPTDAVPVTEQVGANPTLNALATQIVESTSEADITEAAVALSTSVSATNAAVGATSMAAQPSAEMTAVTTEQGVAISTSVSATNAATTPETTGAAVATSEVRIGQEQGPGSTVIAPTAVGSAEATAETTGEATAAATEAAPEGTPVILAEPLVILTGKQTIYLVPQDVISGMIGFLALPPYVYPTATPTLPPTANPYSEVQQTATAMVQATQMQGTMQSIISTATARAVTPEATAAATAEATP